MDIKSITRTAAIMYADSTMSNRTTNTIKRKFIESVYREGHTDYYRRYTLDEPLDLSQIDYILWCGGQIIDVN